MDIDKFRAQWDDPEFVKSYARLDQEPVSEIIKRMERRERREKRWRITRKIILRAPLVVFLGLAGFQIYVNDGQETPLQSVAYMIELVVLCGLNPLEKAQEKYQQPKFWLKHREFLQDENQRIGKNIRLDQWASVMSGVALAALGMYLAPFLSAGLRIVCLAMTGAAVIVLQVYDFRKISQLKRTRDSMAAELDDLQRN